MSWRTASPPATPVSVVSHPQHNQLSSLLSTPAPFPHLLAVSYVVEKIEAIRKGFSLPHHQTHLLLCPFSCPFALPRPPITRQAHDDLKSCAGRLLKDSAPVGLFCITGVSFRLCLCVSVPFSSFHDPALPFSPSSLLWVLPHFSLTGPNCFKPFPP